MENYGRMEWKRRCARRKEDQLMNKSGSKVKRNTGMGRRTKTTFIQLEILQLHDSYKKNKTLRQREKEERCRMHKERMNGGNI